MKVYTLKIALRGVSPMVWRRLRVPGVTSLATLHEAIQIVNGWDNENLHRFHIYAVDYGINYMGGLSFRKDAHKVLLNDFDFSAGDKFFYEYNFFEHHIVDIRVEAVKEWLTEPISPELQYIETKWASYLSYQKTTELLQDILPIGLTHNGVTVRNHLHKIAKRQESELEGKPICLSGCENEWAKLPKPDKPLIVGADGGYVRSCQDKQKNFEVIVGKVYSETKAAKSFGLVQSVDDKPQRRLLDILTQQGMQANQQITFLSDGADNVRDLQFIMHPEAEHVLDWFHITMRLTVLQQFAKGFSHQHLEEGKELTEHLESTKWNLWHGKVKEALEHVDDCYGLCDDEEIKYVNKKKLLKHLEDLSTYVENNSHIIPNYGTMA